MSGTGTPEDPWVEYGQPVPVEQEPVQVTRQTSEPGFGRLVFETHTERRHRWVTPRYETWIDPATGRKMGRRT